MGRLQAEDMAEHGADLGLTLESMVRWHLTGNHYPPVPVVMVQPCLEAIACADEGEWHALIDLPEGVSWRGEESVPVHVIVEEFHLDSFIGYDSSDEDLTD